MIDLSMYFDGNDYESLMQEIEQSIRAAMATDGEFTLTMDIHRRDEDHSSHVSVELIEAPRSEALEKIEMHIHAQRLPVEEFMKLFVPDYTELAGTDGEDASHE